MDERFGTIRRLAELVRRHLMNAGLDDDVFRSLLPDVIRSNMRMLLFLSLMGGCVLSLLTFLSMFFPELRLNTGSYSAVALCCVLLAFVTHAVEKPGEVTSLVLMYVFIVLLLSLGIYLGPISDPENLTVTFIVLLFAFPQVFVDRPWRMLCVVFCSISVYVWVSGPTQSQPVYGSNLVNVFVFGAISACLSLHTMGVRFRELAAVQEINRLGTEDGLTRLGNRSSFELDIDALSQTKRKGVLYVLDVNGLKAVNDTAGHAAGDDLLLRASACISEVFGRHGKCYRIGGDEFVAILDADFPADEDLRRDLVRACSSATSEDAPPLHIAVGSACFDELSDIRKSLKAADKAMYADKARFYTERGMDRRRR